MKNIYSVQSLRALAALSVLLFHEGMLPLGYAGVDLFFVISGLIMGMTGLNDTPTRFFIKRCIRIIPLYWAMTLFKCAISHAGIGSSDFSYDAETFAKSLLFIPYLNDQGRLLPLLVTGWTLNYEMFFYGVFTLGLLLKRPMEFVVTVMVALVAIGSFFGFEDGIRKFFTSPMLLEFVAGLALSRANILRGTYAGAAAFAIGLIDYWALNAGLISTTLPRLILFGLPAFLVVAGALAIERAGNWPRMKFLETIGDHSYSLYLLHGPVLTALAGKSIPFLSQTFKLPVMIAICLAVAALSYRFIELPSARFLRSIFLAKSRVSSTVSGVSP